MGIHGLEGLKGNEISDMQNFIRSRQKKGKTATEVKNDLMEYGYDVHAARGLVMIHWETTQGE